MSSLIGFLEEDFAANFLDIGTDDDLKPYFMQSSFIRFVEELLITTFTPLFTKVDASMNSLS